MGEQATAVLDVGKTLTKLSLWAADGRLVGHYRRANERIETGAYIGSTPSGLSNSWLRASRASPAGRTWVPSFP